MPVNVVVIALSLAGSLGQLEGPSPSPPRLAQDEDRLEEDFGDPPPPPPLELEGEEGVDPADPVGDAPALPPPPVEDTPDAPRADDDDRRRDRDRDRDDDDNETNTLLVRLLQYGAGFGTVAGCTALGTTGVCCGLVCLNPFLTPFAFSLPLLGSCISAASLVVVGAGSGAASGAVQALIGDSFGEEEVGLLWPTVAAAGTGAGILTLMGAASVGSAVLSPTFGAPQPGNINFATPLSCLLSTTSLLLCGAFCVGTPLAGLLTYGSLASSAESSREDREVMLAPPPHAVALAAPAMAF